MSSSSAPCVSPRSDRVWPCRERPRVEYDARRRWAERASLVSGARARRPHHEMGFLMKIALLFDGASALGKSPDLLILETVEAVEAVLATEGNQVVRVPVHTDGRWIERVRRTKCDVVFNLCEG